MKSSHSAATTKRTGAWTAIFLCWFAYVTAYLGRYSYSSNITAIMQSFQVSHADAGLVTTFFFFAYGIGQIVNGLLCRYYNKRIIIPFALITSAILNGIVFIGVPFRYLKYLWMLNGIVQSLLWATLVQVLSENLKTEDLSKAVVVMSTSTPLGTFLIYGFSSFTSAIQNYAYAFLFGTVFMCISAVLWFVLFKKAFRGEGKKPETASAQTSHRKVEHTTVFLIAILAILAIVNNLVKDGLTTWIPSILKENFGLQESLSILLSLVLPMLGMFSAVCNTVLSKKIKSIASLSGIWYCIAALCIGVVMLFLNTKLWYVVLLAFGLVSLLMHNVNNLITSLAPLYMRERINTGFLAGLLNGFCYVGSTISSYGLGSIADNSGWNGVFTLLLVITIGAIVVAAIPHFLYRGKPDDPFSP